MEYKVKNAVLMALLLFAISLFSQPVSPSLRAKMLARADSFSLRPPFKAPPGDPLSHHTSGFAKIMCSAVFITGLNPEFAAENVGYFTAPYPERLKVGKPVIDYEKKTVSIALPNGVLRTAIYTGDQGCVTLPEGKNNLFFTPVTVPRNVPDAAATPWPMGDLLSDAPMPSNININKVKQAVEAAFSSAEAQTAAFVVTYKGRIIAELYGEGITMNTPLESWSMGKSLSATIMGTLMKKGIYTLEQPAPIPQWQGKGDGRAAIRIKDIMHMSSGLYCGERILPEGFTGFVSTLAEPCVADGRPVYGGLFRINGDGTFPISKDAYMMLGAGGQSVAIIPSHDLVVVRLGHYKGQTEGAKTLNKAYALLMEAIPGRQD